MIEKMILEEFGHCLMSIIHTANGTKGKFYFFFTFVLTSFILFFSLFCSFTLKLQANSGVTLCSGEH